MNFTGQSAFPDLLPLNTLTGGLWDRWETGKVKGKYF
jgi:hypothetical protein